MNFAKLLQEGAATSLIESRFSLYADRSAFDPLSAYVTDTSNPVVFLEHSKYPLIGIFFRSSGDSPVVVSNTQDAWRDRFAAVFGCLQKFVALLYAGESGESFADLTLQWQSDEKLLKTAPGLSIVLDLPLIFSTSSSSALPVGLLLDTNWTSRSDHQPCIGYIHMEPWLYVGFLHTSCGQSRASEWLKLYSSCGEGFTPM